MAFPALLTFDRRLPFFYFYFFIINKISPERRRRPSRKILMNLARPAGLQTEPTTSANLSTSSDKLFFMHKFPTSFSQLYLYFFSFYFYCFTYKMISFSFTLLYLLLFFFPPCFISRASEILYERLKNLPDNLFFEFLN